MPSRRRFRDEESVYLLEGGADSADKEDDDMLNNCCGGCCKGCCGAKCISISFVVLMIVYAFVATSYDIYSASYNTHFGNEV